MSARPVGVEPTSKPLKATHYRYATSKRPTDPTAPALFAANTRIAHAIARTYRIPGQDWQDTQQEALIALWEAARMFEPAHGTRFPNFARQVIERRLADALKGALRGKQLVLTHAVREYDTASHDDVCLAVLQRERVRLLVGASKRLSATERVTLRRIVNGTPYTGKQDDCARQKVRHTLHEAAA